MFVSQTFCNFLLASDLLVKILIFTVFSRINITNFSFANSYSVSKKLFIDLLFSQLAKLAKYEDFSD